MVDLARSIITEVTEGEIKRFAGSGRPGETFLDREVFQQYGFTSRPLAGAEGLVLKKGNQVFLIASDDRRYRITVQDGEVALYTDEGDYIHFKRGNIIEINTGDKLDIDVGGNVEIDAVDEVDITAPTVKLNGSVGNIVMSTNMGMNIGSTLQITAGSGVEITAPTITLNGDVIVNGTLHATDNITSDAQITDSTGNTNHHSHP